MAGLEGGGGGGGVIADMAGMAGMARPIGIGIASMHTLAIGAGRGPGTQDARSGWAAPRPRSAPLYRDGHMVILKPLRSQQAGKREREQVGPRACLKESAERSAPTLPVCAVHRCARGTGTWGASGLIADLLILACSMPGPPCWS